MCIINYILIAMKFRKAFIFCFAALTVGNVCAQKQLPYQDSTLSAQQRAEDLLGRLTVSEKAMLMQDSSPGVPRLGIKPFNWWSEALHGYARSGVATVFPQAIGMAASFDDGLLYKVFDAVSDEARAKNTYFEQHGKFRRYCGLSVWTPNINIFRDPRWGRGQETYGEDPYLTSIMGAAVIRGLQGPSNTKYAKLYACAKHFAVHSGPEPLRHVFDVENLSPRDLWETYLPAFKYAVQKAGVKEVMCAYNSFDGQPCCGSNRLLSQILRDEWGFKGLVVSDCGAISDFYESHRTEPDAEHASAKAVLTGTDVECGSNYRTLPDAVKEGLISEDKINVSVLRLLKGRFELGDMDKTCPWQNIPYSVVDSKEHRAMALKMARESMVLLQNDGILPLNKRMKVAVIGPNANDSIMQWGNYNGTPSHTVTLLQAFRSRLPKAQVIYEPVCGLVNGMIYTSLFNQCSKNDKKGFSATYWNNKNFNGDIAATDQLTNPFNFNTEGATVFAPGVNIDNFSSDYRTEFCPKSSGKAVFKLTTNGHVTVSVNGFVVADTTNAWSPVDVYSFPYKAGEKYSIELKFVTYRNNPMLRFNLVNVYTINYDKLLAKLKDVDVVVFAGGISPSLEGEEMKVYYPGFKGGDRTDIELPAVQRNVMSLLKQSGKKVVFVNFSGSAVAMVPETQNCDAILQAWYPGEEGGNAVADVLFGDYNPAGRLPVTFYKSIKQLPDFTNYSMKGRTYRYMKEQPLFPFGYGLSYTKFVYGKASLSTTTLQKGKSVMVNVPVKNTGNRDGEEVVQIYLRRPSDVGGPNKELRGFKRVFIAKGTTKQVKITLPYDNFEWFDTSTNTMHPLAGKYEILYGNNSDSLSPIGINVLY